MYKIYADDILIYDDTSADPYVKVASPTLSLEESAAGSLKMTIPPGNAGYDYIVPMVTDIRVEKDGGIIWDGRVIQESKDFWNNRALTCEGALAFLNDTTQPQAEHSYTGGQAIRLYLQDLIAVHNAHAASNRRISLGAVDVDATELAVTTNYESTMECVNKLVEEHGGFLRIRYVNGSRLLDYLTDNSSARNTNKQTIEFGKNLMDFTSSLDSTEYATVIVPLGAKLEDKKVEGLENYLTVEGSKYSTDHSRYVKASQDVIDQRGWIEKVVRFNDETDADNLYKLGERYLNELQYNTLTIELSAFDLHYLNSEIETVHLGDIIRVISEPHGIDRDFKVRKLEIPMDRPQDTTFQLGDSVQTSLTSTSNKINSEILAKLNEAPDVDTDAILQAAQDNASALMNMTLNGFVTLLTETDSTTGIYSEGLYISASRPLKDDKGNFVAQRFWKWTSSGLGYTDNYGQPGSWKVAMTMDGSIVGERIAAGSIHGSKITAGTLALTTAAGEEACTISLKVLDLPSDALEIGDLDQNDGSNIGSAAQDTARTVIKYYLTAGTTVTVNGYSFEPFLYTDNIDNESGFSLAYGSVLSGSFLIQTTGWYRFVLTGVSGAGVAIDPNDLPKMAASVSLGNPSTVLSSADIRINGMVTFSALSTDSGTTVINGGNIRTGFVKGDRIDAKGMTVTREEQDGSKTVTFMVDNDGNVTINGNVILDQNSIIYFGPSTTKTIGDISEEASNAEDTANKLAYGIYDPPHGGVVIDGTTYTKAFISGTTIYAPTIIANDLIAQAPSGSNLPSGNIGLKDANGVNQLVVTYRTTQTTDGAPGVYFNTAATGVYDFDLPINATGLTISSSTPGVTPQSYFAGRVTLSSQGSVLDLGGTLVLSNGITYVSSYNDLANIPNPEVGQICFVLN